MTCPFQVSDKVVCVNDQPRDLSVRHHYAMWPTQGTVYDVRGLVVGYCQSGPATGLLLTGLHNPLCADGYEYAFHYDRFRKLDEVQAENRARQAQEASV